MLPPAPWGTPHQAVEHGGAEQAHLAQVPLGTDVVAHGDDHDRAALVVHALCGGRRLEGGVGAKRCCAQCYKQQAACLAHTHTHTY